MSNNELPDGLKYPDKAMGLAELAVLYGKSVSTMQRMFKRKGIYELLHRTDGRDFVPEEILIIFILYFPPATFYKSYHYMEQSGYLLKLKEKYKVDEFIENRRKLNGKP